MTFIQKNMVLTAIQIAMVIIAIAADLSVTTVAFTCIGLGWSSGLTYCAWRRA